MSYIFYRDINRYCLDIALFNLVSEELFKCGYDCYVAQIDSYYVV